MWLRWPRQPTRELLWKASYVRKTHYEVVEMPPNSRAWAVLTNFTIVRSISLCNKIPKRLAHQMMDMPEKVVKCSKSNLPSHIDLPYGSITQSIITVIEKPRARRVRRHSFMVVGFSSFNQNR